MTNTARIAAIALVAGFGHLAVPVAALEAHEETAAETAGSPVEFEAGGVTMRAQMPCEDPSVFPSSEGAPETSVCFIDNNMYIFASSSNVAPGHQSGLSSDFDATYAEVANSNDTVAVEEAEVDGRRTMSAERGPAEQFGLMRAIQFAPDGIAFAIAMTNAGDEPVDADTQQIMRNFIASLEIVE